MKSKPITMEEFERRGFKYGTNEEAHDALDAVMHSIFLGEPVELQHAMWLIKAYQGTSRDIQQFVRNLGFHEMGRSRVVNSFDIGNRMAELVEKRGMSKAEASRQCAKEFNCSPSTALAWYAKRNPKGAA